jgi:cobalt-zinc-cadmium efflux system membrane fusion protein
MRNLPSIFTAQGQVIVPPEGSAVVHSLVAGRIHRIFVLPGDKAKRGTPLFQLESLEITALITDFIRTNAELQRQEAEYKRVQDLHTQKIKSEKDLLEVKVNYMAAVANRQAAYQQLLSLGFSTTDLDNFLNTKTIHDYYLTIVSPIDGIVTQMNLETGQLLQPDKDALKVIDLSKLWVKAAAYEKDLLLLAINQETRISPTVNDNQVFKGKVFKINQEVDENSRTIKVYVSLPENTNGLLPNMIVQCHFYKVSNAPVLTIEKSAVMFDGNEHFVFVEEIAGKYRRQEIQINKESEDFFKVTQGLNKDTRVVIEGGFFLKSELEKEKFGDDDK